MIKLPGMIKGAHIQAPTISAVAGPLIPALIDSQIPGAAALRIRAVQDHLERFRIPPEASAVTSRLRIGVSSEWS